MNMSGVSQSTGKQFDVHGSFVQKKRHMSVERCVVYVCWRFVFEFNRWFALQPVSKPMCDGKSKNSVGRSLLHLGFRQRPKTGPGTRRIAGDACMIKSYSLPCISNCFI